MAEFDEKLFEQEFAKMFGELDTEIEIPEIPDVETIFEKAEAEKKESKTVPFKKYSKYIAAAAAVVLICISIPVFADVFSAGFDVAANEAAEEPTMAPREEPAEDYDPLYIVTEESETSTHREEENFESQEIETNPSVGEELKDHIPGEIINAPNSSAASSSIDGTASSSGVELMGLSVKEALTVYFASVKNENPNTGGGGYDDVHHIEENINKKRTIELALENGSVSVVLNDNSAKEEIINAFWVEGNYESSYLDGEYYVINISKKIYKGDLDTDYYLPMVGDENGTYIIPERSVFVPGEVKKGVISMSVSVNVGTGEYSIYASLV